MGGPHEQRSLLERKLYGSASFGHSRARGGRTNSLIVSRCKPQRECVDTCAAELAAAKCRCWPDKHSYLRAHGLDAYDELRWCFGAVGELATHTNRDTDDRPQTNGSTGDQQMGSYSFCVRVCVCEPEREARI